MTDVRPNPAAWGGWLERRLGDPKDKIDRKTGERVARGNFAAMPYRDVARSGGRDDGEGERPRRDARMGREGPRGMVWEEVPFVESVRLWTVPAARMKRGVEHQAPLSGPAIDILADQAAARGKSPFVFPGTMPRRPAIQQS